MKPQSCTIVGWKAIDLDGAIQSVTWSCDGDRGASMLVHRNNDPGTTTTKSFAQNEKDRLQKATAAALQGAQQLDAKRMDLAMVV